jgi:cytochrome c-type biogenesis protein CcmH/NrfG
LEPVDPVFNCQIWTRFRRGPGTGVPDGGVIFSSRRPFSAGIGYVAAIVALTACTFGCGPHKPSPPVASAPNASPPAPSLEVAERILRQTPNDAHAQVVFARAARGTRPAEAARALRAALKLDPTSDEAFRELVSMLQENEYIDRLLEAQENRLKYVPNDVDTMLKAASNYLLIDARGEAQALLVRAAKTKPDDPRLMPALLTFDYQSGKFTEGIASAKQYLAGKPADHAVYYRLSEIQRASEKFADAEASVRAAIKLKQGDRNYHRQLGHILATLPDKSRMAEAEKEIRRAISLGDTGIDARYWLAVTLDNQRRDKDAIAAYEDVAKEDVRYDKTAYRLGRLYQQNGKPAEGAKLLEMYADMEKNRKMLGEAVDRLRKHPDNAENYQRLAAIDTKAEDFGTAIAVVRHALKRFPKNALLKRQLHDSLIAAGRKTEAAKVL